MASGEPDYWYAMMPGKSSLGIGQTFWSKRDTATLHSGDDVFIANHMVPAGYKLVICGMGVSCNKPGINGVYFHLYDWLIGIIHFDVNYDFPPDPGGLYELSAGQSLLIKVYNYDDIDVLYYSYIYGFLVEV